MEIDEWIMVLTIHSVTIYVKISQVENDKLGHKTMYLKGSLVVWWGLVELWSHVWEAKS